MYELHGLREAVLNRGMMDSERRPTSVFDAAAAAQNVVELAS